MINLLELSIVNVHYRTYYKIYGYMKRIMKWPVVLSLMMVQRNGVRRTMEPTAS